MTFDEWWDTDERFAVAHEDEKTQARAAWKAALEVAAIRCDEIQKKTDNWGPMAGYCAEQIRLLTPPK